jgi:membrane fusion protein, multidrug efflux system
MPPSRLEETQDQSFQNRSRVEEGTRSPAPDIAQRDAAERRARANREANALEERSSSETRPAEQASWWSIPRRRPVAAAAVTILVIMTAVGGSIWWLDARQYVSTDDAFVDARTASISSQVNGAIVDVPVTDNQLVDADGVLARIDDRDYKVAVDQARAQVDQAQATISNLDAQIDAQQARVGQAEKQVAEAQAALTFAREEDVRAQDLLKRGAGTQQRAQQTASDLRQRQAAFDGAEANLVAAQKQIAVLSTQREVATGQLEQAQATKEQAEISLARTVIVAPTAGRATKITAAKGNYAQTGQALMMFVPRELWVTANFKETQLVDMRPGQRVEVRVDAYPGRPFRAHVDSIQAGSGAAFSLLPPENATGNFVKVVQRVPVKIVFDDAPGVYLGPGMSVVPDVKVR